jgi:hypothetical protein
MDPSCSIMQRVFNLGSRTVRIFVLAVCLGSGPAGGAFAVAQEGNASQASWLHFDIPAQPLTSALQAYSIVTGREVFYDGALVLGRRSATVSGIFPPDAALRTLLQGTEFVPRALGSNGFTITLAPPAAIDPSGPTSAPAPDGSYEWYFAALQTNLREVLCGSSETRPGSYRLIIKFWLDPSGAILRPALIGSTGNPDRDKAFVAALPTAKANGPPPVGMPQPVTMVVFPGPSGELGECVSRHASGRAN